MASGGRLPVLTQAGRWLETVRHLRAEQLLFRLYHPAKRLFYRPSQATPPPLQAPELPALPLFPEEDRAVPQEGRFDWLHQPHRFSTPTWGRSPYGALWDYHLHSFTWLERAAADDLAVEALLASRAAASDVGMGNDPYPTSLRLTAAVRWLLRSRWRADAVARLLFADAHRLAAFPEYHLLGNHLLENAIGLFHAAVFFNHDRWRRQAVALLRREVPEQFLTDGAHYERSIAYHAKLLAGLLKCMQLASLCPTPEHTDVERLLRPVIGKGLGWMAALQFTDGSYPAFGDSVPDPLPALDDLLAAAAALGIASEPIALGASGFRKRTGTGWELVATVGNALPDYQPGHAHADALSFCIQAHGRPLVVDTGISTYERSARRLAERGTAAHNSVVVHNRDSAAVWASFRMGHRARVRVEVDDPNRLQARHDGYRAFGIRHTRTFATTGAGLVVEDRLDGPAATAEAFLHFHPDVIPALDAERGRVVAAGVSIDCDGFAALALEPYDWCGGFNLRHPAYRLRASLRDATSSFRFRF